LAQWQTRHRNEPQCSHTILTKEKSTQIWRTWAKVHVNKESVGGKNRRDYSVVKGLLIRKRFERAGIGALKQSTYKEIRRAITCWKKTEKPYSGFKTKKPTWKNKTYQAVRNI